MSQDCVKISVRNLVEFMLRSGNIEAGTGYTDVDTMQEGGRLHRKIQKKMGSFYTPEVSLQTEVPLQDEAGEFVLVVEGRADGVMKLAPYEPREVMWESSIEPVQSNFLINISGEYKKETSLLGESEQSKEGMVLLGESEQSKKRTPLFGMSGEYETPVVIDEIKTTYRNVSLFQEAAPLHLAQAKCYAYIYAMQENLTEISVQITYCNVETEAMRYFVTVFQTEQLKQWFNVLIQGYAKWVLWERAWRRMRNASIKALEFPFAYRTGQKELVTGVYRTLIRGRKVFIEAPTGVGKTISTVFPAVKAVGEEKLEKLFYLTAKTIARTVAEDTFRLLLAHGLKYKVVTLTAKEKICVLGKPECNPLVCERAKGHFDRVNDAVFDLLTHEEAITRELIETYAEKHQVCPFEMCLDVTNWADAVICDYNYVFDPSASLKRFFAGEKKQPFAFLIDEAHNLVERAKEMYSAVLRKEDFLAVKKIVKEKQAGVTKKNESYHAERGKTAKSDAVRVGFIKKLETCNTELLRLKRECEQFKVLEEAENFTLCLLRLVPVYEEYLQEFTLLPEEKDAIWNLYFEIRHFMAMHDSMGEDYTIYTSYEEDGSFFLKLQCMNPAQKIKDCVEKGRSSVFFSATLLPIRYYKEQLSGDEDDYAIYVPSPFAKENRKILLGTDVSTRYTRRSEGEYRRIVAYIKAFVQEKTGNYMVFFSSYQMLTDVARLAKEELPNLLLQKNAMTEEEKEAFLEEFVQEPQTTKIGFCVLGGIFGEGIDLKGDRLIGAVIVGTGLPLVCKERELFREYYEQRNGQGFAYAYLYQGMNKVLQAAGRVIRTVEDKGVVLLLEERFGQRQYQELFPREWFPHETVTLHTLPEKLKQFWKTSH